VAARGSFVLFRLLFHGESEIQSAGEMLFGTLAFHNAQCTAWNGVPPTDTDIYFGWQIFVGGCHSAIVVDDGTLAIISEPPGGDCADNPSTNQQCFLPIPGWDLGKKWPNSSYDDPVSEAIRNYSNQTRYRLDSALL
jgi:hypothetical protein